MEIGVVDQSRLVENTISGQTQFSFVQPTKLIEKEGFVGAYWGGVPKEQMPKQLMVRGKPQNVDVFGFQSLAGESTTISLHPENTQTELTYILQGKMDMKIVNNLNEDPVISHMEGQITSETNLSQANFVMLENGVLYVTFGEPTSPICYVITPTVTPKGAWHGTEPKGDCVYLAVKVSE